MMDAESLSMILLENESKSTGELRNMNLTQLLVVVHEEEYVTLFEGPT